MAKKSKLPKKIGGVRIPKKVRKQGSELLAKVNTPLGRELIAAGLVAAGAAIASKSEVRKAARRAAGEAEDAGELGARMAGQIGGIVGAAANAALDRFFGARAGEAGGEPEASPPGSTAH
jgi:hypothetical protein